MGLTRRGFMLGSVALAAGLAFAGAAQARPIKGSRAAPTNLIVPYSPLWTSATPSSGQVALAWQAPTQLWGGSSITADPVTSYRVRIASTRANVEVGGTPASTATTTSTSYTFTSVAAGVWWVSVSASNSAGESDASIPYEVTVP